MIMIMIMIVIVYKKLIKKLFEYNLADELLEKRSFFNRSQSR